MMRRVTAWLQLLRLPNVFTAAADVTMGFLVTQRGLEPQLDFAMLVVASCLLYLSGMVLNDVFDAEVDAPSGPSDRFLPAAFRWRSQRSSAGRCSQPA